MTIGFRAHKGGVEQPAVPNNAYTLVLFGATAFDDGPCFSLASGLWAPPPGLVTLNGQVWIDAGAGGPNANFVAKIFKNGAKDVVAGIGTLCSQPGVAVIPFACVDQCEEGDTYGLHLWASALDPAIGCTINGNPAHTWFSGAVIE